jgi:hypothetical protein
LFYLVPLSEMIKHHVKEEEQRDGMFAEARNSNMDLKQIGEPMAERKQQLESAASAGGTSLRMNEAYPSQPEVALARRIRVGELRRERQPNRFQSSREFGTRAHPC